MMRHLFIILAFVAAITMSCSRKAAPDTAASEAAQALYDKLLKGDYEGFVSGMYFPDRIPDGYRQQLVANAKMFMANQSKEHEGIVAANVIRQERDSLSSTVEVFILLSYNDSTQEEVVVPMIESEGVWLMR